MESYAELGAQEENRKKRRFNLLLGLIAGAACLYGFWQLGQPAARALRRAESQVERLFERATNPRNLIVASRLSSQDAAVSHPLDEFRRRPAASSPFAAGARPMRRMPPASASPATSVGASNSRRSDGPAFPPFNSGTHWAAFGTVFDILTLKPAAGVVIAFKGGNGSIVYNAVTDAAGRYVALLPRESESAFTAEAMDRRYAPTVLCEPDIPYRRLSPDDRRSLSHAARQGDLSRAPFREAAAEKSERRDLFLAPQS